MSDRRVEWADLPLALTSEQAAAVLQIKRRTVTNMLDRGELRGVKVGRTWRISRAALMQLVEDARPTRELHPPEIADAGGNGFQPETEPPAISTGLARPEPSRQAQAAVAETRPVWEHAGIFNLVGLGAGGAPDMSSDKYKYFAEALG
jgi:excisionase family DNA binding protein